MSERHVGTLEELYPLLQDALAGLDLPAHAEVMDALQEALDPAAPPEGDGPTRRVDISLNERDRYYAVHDSDLPSLKDAVSIASAFVHNNPLSSLASLAGLLFKYRRKRIPLSGDQGAVLLALKKAPVEGWTAGELAQQVAQGRTLDETAVASILDGFKAVRHMDGSVTALVTEQGGRFRALDV